jgi:hypothetical protein
MLGAMRAWVASSAAVACLGLAIALIVPGSAAAAPLTYSRAVTMIHIFARKGCTPDHHCESWRLTGCSRRSPFKVSCRFVGEVDSTPCRNTITASLFRSGAFERTTVSAEPVKACPLGRWVDENAPPPGPPTD